MDPDEVRKAITPQTRAIMLVHLLGNPCDMDAICSIAKEHDLIVIEDSCEAHGAEWHGKKVGSFGDLATFSFFYSHHISTIEGGMVLTSREEYAELARAIRAFGWIRDLRDRGSIAAQYPEIDAKYLFTGMGYNLRPTEIQGAFGIHQIDKLDRFIESRQVNSDYWAKRLRPHSRFISVHSEQPDTRHVWFGYQLTVDPDAPFTRGELTDFLQSKNVETRPVMSGNMAEQPVMEAYAHRVQGDLPTSRVIMRNSFYFGNHHEVGPEQRAAIGDYLDEFFGRYASP
jgi:CDP-6-deoxy-D-xylo-4-hexulose-3-dehydrase